jgi:hypothetical protein
MVFTACTSIAAAFDPLELRAMSSIRSRLDCFSHSTEKGFSSRASPAVGRPSRIRRYGAGRLL